MINNFLNHYFFTARRLLMKNPLDSLWGTVISGLVLTLVLYLFVKNVLITAGG